MSKVRSVNWLIGAQFALIVTPLTAVVGYQMVADNLNAHELDRAFVISQGTQSALDSYHRFRNGAADAVDTGRIGADTQQALVDTERALSDIGSLTDQSGVAAIVDKIRSLRSAIAAESTVTTLTQQRDTINAVDAYINSTYREHHEASTRSIATVIANARRQFMVVASVMVLTALITGFCIWNMMRRFTRPLERAQQAAQDVAAGRLRSDDAWVGDRDLGNLLQSLASMNDGLRRIVSGVKQSADLTGASAVQFGKDALAAAETAALQGGWVGVTRVSMREMNASIDGVSSLAHTTLEVAERVKVVALKGNDRMQESLAYTDRVLHAVDQSASAIVDLSHALGRIAEMTELIKGVAEQTNLLALNAAIEAARAGEQGRGFAVVADEVRRLAERTAASTADISNLVQAITTTGAQAVARMNAARSEVQHSAEISRTTGTYLTEIVDAATEVHEAARRIDSAAGEQHTISRQATENMSQLARLEVQNAEKLEAMCTAVQTLQTMADDLIGSVGGFSIQ